MKTYFVMSSNPDNLQNYLKNFEYTSTVEAEYGDRCVEGTMYTWAHHGPRGANKPPCVHNNVKQEYSSQVVGLSHIDLDAVGGCMALCGCKPEAPGFWGLAAFVDVNGPHKLSQAKAHSLEIAQLYAFWAFSQSNRVMPPRDGGVIDVTPQVQQFFDAINAILAGDPALLQEGKKFADAEDKLNFESFLGCEGGVITRSADAFTNHLYVTPMATEIAQAVVAFNEKNKSVTVSLSDQIPGVSACKIVQALWGQEAGGHDGIAGSPRNREMTIEDLEKCAAAVRAAINE